MNWKKNKKTKKDISAMDHHSSYENLDSRLELLTRSFDRIRILPLCRCINQPINIASPGIIIGNIISNAQPYNARHPLRSLLDST